MVRVRDGDFSYIVLPLDGDKSDCFFMSESALETFILKETETLF